MSDATERWARQARTIRDPSALVVGYRKPVDRSAVEVLMDTGDALAARATEMERQRDHFRCEMERVIRERVAEVERLRAQIAHDAVVDGVLAEAEPLVTVSEAERDAYARKVAEAVRAAILTYNLHRCDVGWRYFTEHLDLGPIIAEVKP